VNNAAGLCEAMIRAEVPFTWSCNSCGKRQYKTERPILRIGWVSDLIYAATGFSFTVTS
jgi:hypothetical protein